MLNEISTGGRAIRYREAGRGEPLVLLHAFPLTPAMWEPQLQSPPEGWRVIAPCLRGFGKDASGLRATSMDDYAADVVGLLSALGIRRAVIGGLSMGGYVMFALHRQAPDLFRAAVLMDTRPQADTAEGRAGRERMLALVDEEGPGGVARDMLPKLVSAATRRNHPEIVDHVRAMIEGNSAEGIKDAVRAMMGRPDSTDRVREMRLPALVVVGEEDTLTPVEDAEAMHRALSGSRLLVVPGAGHLSSLERPDVVNAELAQWLLEVRESEGGA